MNNPRRTRERPERQRWLAAQQPQDLLDIAPNVWSARAKEARRGELPQPTKAVPARREPEVA